MRKEEEREAKDTLIMNDIAVIAIFHGLNLQSHHECKSILVNPTTSWSESEIKLQNSVWPIYFVSETILNLLAGTYNL